MGLLWSSSSLPIYTIKVISTFFLRLNYEQRIAIVMILYENYYTLWYYCNTKSSNHFLCLYRGKNVGTIEDQRETWLLWIYLNICKNDAEYLQQCLSSRDKTSPLEYCPHLITHYTVMINIVLFSFSLWT